MKTAQNNPVKLSENIIIADADYADRVAFDLIVNFERMLDRRIPQADLSQWLVDLALDGGLKPGKHETQVVLLHDKNTAKLENFSPSDYDTDLHGKAFKDDSLGEFVINALPVEPFTTKQDMLLDMVKTVLEHPEAHRVMIVPNAEDDDTWNMLRRMLRDVDDDERHITLFAMQPMEGGNFKQQILGFSLMNAMGITQAEIDRKMK
ncbi:MAG: DUF6621 family protein [Prevotella sp.]|nr:DUF6621 family protein [Prevotella sp.]